MQHAVLTLLLCVYRVSAQAALYSNPILPLDFPDASIARVPATGMFMAYASAGNGLRLQVSSSSDLVTWAAPTEGMPTPPGWAKGGCFRAPDVQAHGGVFYLYYTAATAVDGGGVCTDFCVGVATSAAPGGPFVDAPSSPLVCGAGRTASDPHSFDDPASQAIYLYWGGGGGAIMGRQLAPNRTAWADGAPPALPLLLPNATRPYQYQTIIEAPWLHYSQGWYYLLFSGSLCCGADAHYAVLAARGSTPLGPFVRRGDSDNTGNDVLLAQAGNASTTPAAPGHVAVVTDDVGNDFILYSAYANASSAAAAASPNGGGPRTLRMDLLNYATPNGTLSMVGIWPRVGGAGGGGDGGGGGGVPVVKPQVVPYLKPLTSEGAANVACLRASLHLPSPAHTSAGVYDVGGRLVRTLWSRKATPAGEVLAIWDGSTDGGLRAPECSGSDSGKPARAPAAASHAYAVKILAFNVTYVWEGTVGNSGVWQVGPNVLRALVGIADMDIGGGLAAVSVGYTERSKPMAIFNTSAPHDWVWVGHEDYHTAFTHSATDGEVAYFLNSGVAPESNTSYYYSPWTWVAAVDLSAPSHSYCEFQFTYGQHVCHEGAGQTSPAQACANDINGSVPQVWSSVIDVRQDSGTINTSGILGSKGGFAYPSTGTGIAVQLSPGTLLAVAHGYQGVIAVFHKKSGAPLGNVSIPAGLGFVGALRFTPSGEGLWALTSVGVTLLTGLSSGVLSVAFSVPLSTLPTPSALGVQSGTGAALVTSDELQQVFVVDAGTGAVVATVGEAGGYTAATGPTVTPQRLGFYGMPYVAGDGSGGMFVGDALNSRTLQLTAKGEYVDDVGFICASYVSAVPSAAPHRVFSNFLEFFVDYSKPLGAPGSWTLVRNWAAGASLDLMGRGSEWGGPTSLAVVAGGRTFGVVGTAGGHGHSAALVEFVMPNAGEGVPGGMVLLRTVGGSGLLPMGQLDSASGNFHFSVPSPTGFAVYAAPLTLGSTPTATTNYTCDPSTLDGCVLLARVNQSAPELSLSPRTASVGYTTPLSPDGRLLIVLDGSIGRNGGYHLGALDTTTSSWAWQASPWGVWEYGSEWEVLQPGSVNTSVGYLTEATMDGRYGSNDATINYAGNKVLLEGESLLYGFHGEFWQDAEANQFLHFHAPSGLFVGQFGRVNKRTTNFSYPFYALPGQAGNAFSPSLVQAQDTMGAPTLYAFHNDESQHSGVHRWRLEGAESMELLTAINVN